jgi:transposase
MLFSYVRPDSRIPPNHSLRLIRRITDAALASMSAQFDGAYSGKGRPSIPPERLLRALLIQALY